MLKINTEDIFKEKLSKLFPNKADFTYEKYNGNYLLTFLNYELCCSMENSENYLFTSALNILETLHSHYKDLANSERLQRIKIFRESLEKMEKNREMAASVHQESNYYRRNDVIAKKFKANLEVFKDKQALPDPCRGFLDSTLKIDKNINEKIEKTNQLKVSDQVKTDLLMDFKLLENDKTFSIKTNANDFDQVGNIIITDQAFTNVKAFNRNIIELDDAFENSFTSIADRSMQDDATLDGITDENIESLFKKPNIVPGLNEFSDSTIITNRALRDMNFNTEKFTNGAFNYIYTALIQIRSVKNLVAHGIKNGYLRHENQGKFVMSKKNKNGINFMESFIVSDSQVDLSRHSISSRENSVIGPDLSLRTIYVAKDLKKTKHDAKKLGLPDSAKFDLDSKFSKNEVFTSILTNSSMSQHNGNKQHENTKYGNIKTNCAISQQFPDSSISNINRIQPYAPIKPRLEFNSNEKFTKVNKPVNYNIRNESYHDNSTEEERPVTPILLVPDNSEDFDYSEYMASLKNQSELIINEQTKSSQLNQIYRKSNSSNFINLDQHNSEPIKVDNLENTNFDKYTLNQIKKLENNQVSSQSLSFNTSILYDKNQEAFMPKGLSKTKNIRSKEMPDTSYLKSIMLQNEGKKYENIATIRSFCSFYKVEMPEFEIVRENDVFRCTATFMEINFVSNYKYDKQDAKDDACSKLKQYITERWVEIFECIERSV